MGGSPRVRHAPPGPAGRHSLQAAGNNQLDGNGDGAAGDDYTTPFTVAPSSAVVVSLPDFTRGPGQTVTVPSTSVSAGIPLRLSNGNGVTSLNLTLTYNPALLNLTGIVRGTGLP